MEFRLLGPFEAWHEGTKIELGERQQRYVLVVLLLNAGRPVSPDRLLETVWPVDRPTTNLVPNYMTRIRTLLRDREGVVLEKTQTGYVLTVEPELLDTWRFESLKDAAAEAKRHNDPVRARQLLHQALALWRGDFLEDLDIDRVGGPGVVPSDDLLIDVTCDLAELELTAGEHRWVRDHVRPLLQDHPAHHRLTPLLMRALLADGDRRGAKNVFHDAKEELDKAGDEPPREWRRLFNLAHDGSPASRLPRSPKAFTDREGPLGEMTALAERGADRLVWVSGPPGVGKTAFAVQAARGLTEQFTDGSLFVQLNGFTPEVDPLSPADALEQLLLDLDVPDEQIPKTVAARAALYQEQLLGTRTLVVLDNAASDEHVQHLVPDAPGCLAVVTSRRVSELLDGGSNIRLAPLSSTDGAAQFRALVDPARVAGADADVERIAIGCGGLPLAIRLMAAQFTQHQAWPLSHLAELLEQHEAWGTDADASAMTAATIVSYRHLDADQQSMFRLCASVPGADFDVLTAAAVADCTVTRARLLLDGLHGVGLLEEQATERYSILDPLREVVRSLPPGGDPASSSDLTGTPLDRLLDFFLVTTHAAVATAYPFATDQLPDPERTSAVAKSFPDAAAALEWLAAERANLVATVNHAATHDRPEHTWKLSVLLWRYLYATGRLDDWLDTLKSARHVMAAEPGSLGYAQVLLRLSAAYWQNGQLRQALEVAAQALPKWVALGDVRGEADTLCAIAAVSADLVGTEEAISHFEAALGKYESIGDDRGQANALSMLGHLSHQRGDYAVAAERQRAAVELLEAIGNKQGLAHTLDNLGSALQHLDDLDAALSSHRQAETLADMIGDQVVKAYAISNIGNVHRRRADAGAAADCHRRALEIAGPLGDPNLVTQIHLDTAETCLAAGDAAGATRSAQTAVDLATETGDTGKLALAYFALARALHLDGDHESAAGRWDRAETALEDAGMPQLPKVRSQRGRLDCACRTTVS